MLFSDNTELSMFETEEYLNFYMLTTPQNIFTMTQQHHHSTAIQQYNDTMIQQLSLTLYS